MTPAPDPPPPADPDDGLPSVEDFALWLAESPANMAAFEQFAASVARGECGEVPPEALRLVQVFLAQRKEGRCLEVVVDRMRALQEVMNRPPGSMRAKERDRQCKALMEEITDALLDTPEPHRTRLLKELLPIRERIRALQVDDI